MIVFGNSAISVSLLQCPAAQRPFRTNRALAFGSGPIGSVGPLGIAIGPLKQHSALKNHVIVILLPPDRALPIDYGPNKRQSKSYIRPTQCQRPYTTVSARKFPAKATWPHCPQTFAERPPECRPTTSEFDNTSHSIAPSKSDIFKFRIRAPDRNYNKTTLYELGCTRGWLEMQNIVCDFRRLVAQTKTFRAESRSTQWNREGRGQLTVRMVVIMIIT